MKKTNITQWKNEGYTIVHNFFNEKIIQKAQDIMNSKYNLNNLPNPDFGSKNNELEFPSNTILDKLTLNPKLISAVSALLETPNILLTQSDAWSKTTTTKNFKNKQSNDQQRSHMDYGNHTYLHPSEWENPEAVAIIVYLSDLSKTGGATAIVPRTPNTAYLYKPPYLNMPGQKNYTFFNSAFAAENYFIDNHPLIAKFRKDLYINEIQPIVKTGTVLFYRLDVWHRGTPTYPNKIRHVMNICYKKRECYWIYNWNQGFARKNYYGKNEKIFTELTPRQRSVLGIPLPGDKYWTLKKIQYLKARYPNINIKPYLSKL